MTITNRGTTLRDVARLVGVSVATVSAALNNSGRVSSDTRDRILQAAEALNYVPNLAARSLQRSRTNVIGVIIGQLSPASFEIVTGINHEGRAQHRQLLIGTTEINAADESRRIRDLASGLADGVILITPVSPPEQLNELRQLDTPIVLVNYRQEGANLPLVYGENLRAATELTAHLISLGHRRIAFVTGRHASGQSDERERGYRIALNEAGLPFDERLVFPGDFSLESGTAAATAIMKLGGDGPTAIFAANDQTARGVVEGLAAAGAHVPEDYSVVGFDAAPMERMLPELTTVRHPFREVGTAATRLLGQLIDATPEERDRLSQTVIEIPSVVEIWESTAAPRSSL